MNGYRLAESQVLALLAQRVNDVFLGVARFHDRAARIDAELAVHRRRHRKITQALQRPVRGVVTAVLAELDPTATLVDLEQVAGVYTVQIALPGEVGKAIRIPARVLERAVVNPEAWRTVWNLIRSAVLTVRSQRNVSDARETLARSSRRRQPG
ncbi:MAG: hypothetical protein ACREMB_22990 [Candidatus Rokuibacteriota bacterium]